MQNNVTINAGGGNDDIYNSGDNVGIYGEDGDDVIENDFRSARSDLYTGNIYNNENVTISGGGGDDTIYSNGAWSVFRYCEGDGNDVIYWDYSRSFKGLQPSNDTLVIEGGQYSTIVNGDDAIISVGDGSITFKKRYTLPKIIVRETTPNTSSNGSIKHVSLESIQKSYDTYEYLGGDKVISDYSSGNKVKYNTDFTGIDVNGDDLLIKSSSGSLKLENVRNEVINITDNDENTIAYAYLADYEGVVDGSGFDTFEVIAASEEVPSHLISGDGGSSLISGGSNDTLQGGAGQDTFIYNKGNDVVINYQDREKINFSATYTGFGFDDNNFFLNAMEGSLTIQNHKDKWIDIATADGNVVAHAYIANNGGIIDGRSFNELAVIVGGNNARDTIHAGSVGSSLWGGNDGFDTLSGGTGVDMFFYGNNDGDDWIQSASEKDVINLYDVNLADIIAADWADPGARAEEGAVFEQAIVFTSGRTLGISNLNNVSPTFQLADGSKWQFNRSTTSWQST